MLDSPFMDAVHKASYHEMMPGGHKDAAHRRILARYRQSLRRAQRFVMDDAAVRLACELTRQSQRMELWSILARLPFDTVWIEFDMHTKVRKWEQMGTIRHPFVASEVSQSCGYLLQADLDSPTRWIATEFIEVDGVPIPQPLVMVFDPEGSGLKPVTGSTLFNELTLSRRPGFPKMPVTVITGQDFNAPEQEFPSIAHVDAEFGFIGLIDTDSEGQLQSPEWTHHKVGIVPEPMWSERITDRRRLDQTLQLDVSERTGALRWLLVALAMLNDVPHTTRSVQGRPGRAQTRSGPIKYLDHHVVTIHVPKRPQIRWAARELDRAATKAHRAWHRVRGFWRITEYGRQKLLCKHEPTDVLDGLATCHRCQRQIRWINPFERGDPLLGMIEHSYQIKG